MPAGFLSLLDFTGLPAGFAVRRGGGKGGGGLSRRLVRQLAFREHYRRSHDERAIARAAWGRLAGRVEANRAEFEMGLVRIKRRVEEAIYSAALAEV